MDTAVHLVLVLAAVALLAPVQGQQCGENECTRECIPVQWQRDLCTFYVRLEEWRSTVVKCGLSVPAIHHDNTLPAEEQWEEAHQQWEVVRALWEEVALEEGIISNRGTADGHVTEGSSLDNIWLQDMEQWLDLYDNWREAVNEQGPTPQYPISGPPYSDDWQLVFSDWSQDFVEYNTTYYDTC